VAGKLVAVAEEDKILVMAVGAETTKVLESFGGEGNDGMVVGVKLYHGASLGGERHFWTLEELL